MGVLVMLAVRGGLMLLELGYHRLFDKKPKADAHILKIPQAEPGTPIPLIYGTVMQKEPLVAWAGHKRRDGDGVLGRNIFEDLPEPRDYFADFLFIIGIPPRNATCNFRRIWYGDGINSGTVPAKSLIYYVANGDGIDRSTHSTLQIGTPESVFAPRGLGVVFRIGKISYPGEDYVVDQLSNGEAWFHDGRDTQTFDLVRDYVADEVDPTLFPSFRGYMTLLLFNDDTTDISTYPVGGKTRWKMGQSTDPAPYPMEVSAWDANPLHAGHAAIGLDANPIDVIRDVLTGTFGKLGLPVTTIDGDSFTAAAITLTNENHGYSRRWNDGTGADFISEILEQIDGILFEDPASRKIKIRLIRPDVLIPYVLNINPDNCEDVTDVDFGSYVNAPDHIIVRFTDRENKYEDGVAEAMDHASVNGITDDKMITLQLSYPGCTTRELANHLAARELAARGRPLVKLRAICDRSMAGLVPGDVVTLTWPKFSGMSGVAFRVVSPTRGNANNRTVTVDLLQDFYYRSSTSGSPLEPTGDAFPPGSVDVAPEG